MADTHPSHTEKMNFPLASAAPFLFFIPVIGWVVSLYLILRFLRAFERGVHALERIADDRRRDA